VIQKEKKVKTIVFFVFFEGENFVTTSEFLIL